MAVTTTFLAGSETGETSCAWVGGGARNGTLTGLGGGQGAAKTHAGEDQVRLVLVPLRVHLCGGKGTDTLLGPQNQCQAILNPNISVFV